MSRTKSSNDRIEILVGEIPKKRNVEHSNHKINYKGAGFSKDKKKELFKNRKHKGKEF